MRRRDASMPPAGVCYGLRMLPEAQGAPHGRGPARTVRTLAHRALLAALLSALALSAWSGAAFAQAADPGGAPAPTGEADVVKGNLADDATPALFSVGLSAGFPSYQTVALAVSLQAEFVGAQLKGSWTPAGVYLGGQLRVYPPVPVPVPLYLGVGGGVYGSNGSYHFVLGTHVPLGKALRLDLEGGVANVPQLAERAWVPHLAAGLSYAFPVSLAPGGEGPGTRSPAEPGPGGGACTAPGEPDGDLIPAVIDAMVDDWILSARATYGSVYRGLDYRYSIKGVRLSGNAANVTVAYSGSVEEILTGARHSASGEARVRLDWTGCGWRGGSVEY